MTTAVASSTRVHGHHVGAYRRAEQSPRHRSVGAPSRRAPFPERPNYVARRLVAAAVTVLTIATLAVVISGVLASFGGGPASASEVSSANTDLEVRSHVARSGDTMWSIASTYRGDVDHSRYVDALIRSNGGVSIVVGQAVQLP